MDREVLVPTRPIPELGVTQDDRVYWDPAISPWPLLVRPIRNTGRVLAAVEAGWLRPEVSSPPPAESRAAVNHPSASRLRRRWRPYLRHAPPQYLALLK